MAETIDEIVAAHRAGTLTPRETVARSYARLRHYNDPALFISLRDEAEALAEAEAIAKTHADCPLFGVPIGVKDNIDVFGLPTTVACPAFSYQPVRDATAVARLRAAGAIVIGKTNLDQFATGLVGLRSPYGVPRNPFNPAVIPGGSSSGSAVTVAVGIVTLSLGTDTAGSGRVPAGLNNIVGLKPSLGLVSTAGVVPACRTLDCVSVFALTTDDAWTALSVLAGPDRADPYSRPRPLGGLGAIGKNIRIGVPIAAQRLFFGDLAAMEIYAKAVERFAALGAAIVETDIGPFYEAARLLYEGPWVAERYLVARALLASSPDAIHPVTRKIIVDGSRPTAADTFAAYYELEELRRVRDVIFRSIDALLLPTAPTVYTVQQVLADPIQLNSRLGTYTNFVNLLDLCGLALPAAMRDDGVPSGITLLAQAGQDAFLASMGRVFHANTALPLGALKVALPPLAAVGVAPAPDEIALAVVGAHLSGLSLNHELRNVGARLLQATSTAPDYRLFALPGGEPRRPGLLRVAAGEGRAIEVETWAMSAQAFGRFVANVPPPLSIGTLKLADGRMVKGFLVEAEAVRGAPDVSSFGGWRAYLAQTAAAAAS